MIETANLLRKNGFPIQVVSVGATPTAQTSCTITGITEIRPGNYVFHDMMQVRLGTATLESCALSVLAKVISGPTDDRAVIDAGAKTLTLDKGAHGLAGVSGHGFIPSPYRRDIVRLSEEHGVIAIDSADPLKPGDRLRIIPNHACAVVNLHDRLTIVDGATVVEEWPVHARGRTS